jgi:hypothetical protein
MDELNAASGIKSSQTIKSLGERFEKGKNLFSSRSSECYLGSDRVSGSEVLLWILRYPLDPQSEEARLFTERLEKISASGVRTPNFIDFGVDARGTAFLATEYIELKSLIDNTWIPVELEEQFSSALRELRSLHVKGIFLEDVSESSFLLNPAGEVVLGALLGDFESGARKTAMLPPTDTLHFVAPEQRSGGAANSSTDVFSLGVFGYRLFTGRYLHGDRQSMGGSESQVETAPAPSILRSDLPNWVDDVLGNCLESEPSQRYSDAGELLGVIEESIKTGVAPGGSSAWSKKTAAVSKEAVEAAGKASEELVKISPNSSRRDEEDDDLKDLGDISPAKITPKKKRAQKAASAGVPVTVWVVALAIGFGIAGFVFLSIASLEDDPTAEIVDAGGVETVQSSNKPLEDIRGDDPIAFMAQYSPPELREYIYTIGSSEQTMEARKDALTRIAQNSDPTSFGVLVTLIQNGKEPVLREEAGKLLVVKIKGEGLPQTSRVLNAWLGSLEPEKLASPSVTNVLRAIDIGRPLRARQDSLREAHVTDPSTALTFAAALSIDLEDADFSNLLRDFLADQTRGEDLSTRGLGALLLSHPSTSHFIEGNISETIDRFSDEDLRWALLRTVEESSDKRLLRDLAQEFKERNILTPYKSIFLDALLASMPVDKDSHPLAPELVRGAMGRMTAIDVQKFARWDSQEAEKVLFSACASSTDPETAVQAFDILARRTIANEAAEKLVNWVKSRFWDYRKRLVRSVGILALFEISSEEQVSQAFDDLLPFTKGGLFKVLASTNNPYLMKESVRRLGAITPSSELLTLLDSSDKEVRIAAVKALKERNELAVLQGILRAFKQESDPEVQKVYREFHWVTRDRNAG